MNRGVMVGVVPFLEGPTKPPGWGMEVTNWQAHTVRGFVSILGSKGGESSKNAAQARSYRFAK